MFLTVSKEEFFLVVHLYILYKDNRLSYFADAQMPVGRFSETSYTMKFFRTASEFFLCFSGKMCSGVSTGGF